MTRHTRYAVTYGAVVALASALVAPSAAFAAPDATGGEVTPAAQQRPQTATQQANNTDTDQQTVTADDGASLRWGRRLWCLVLGGRIRMGVGLLLL